MNWLAWGTTFETLLIDNPDMTQDQVAQFLAKDPSWLGKLLKLLSL
jgi:hypothetical protein